MSSLGLVTWTEGGVTHGRAAPLPGWYRRDGSLRISALAFLADVVGGMPPTGAINPTVDLRVQYLADMGHEGPVHAVCHPAKVGRRLFVGELVFDQGGTVIARATVTFMNERIGDPEGDGTLSSGWAQDGAGPPPSFELEGFLHPSFPEPGMMVVELAPNLYNGYGAMQGSVLAVMADLASERAFGADRPLTVRDLDIRFLNRAKTGAVAAIATIVGSERPQTYVRVALCDANEPTRLIAVATTVCHG